MTKIAAGIILYNPNIERLIENVNHILPQVSFLVLTDNGSNNINQVEELYVKEQRILIIKNKENLGIAVALNQVMQYCFEHDFSWVLTLDQDSVCSRNLIECYSPYEVENVAIISPIIIDQNTHDQLEGNKDFITCDSNKKQYHCISRCITSGSLTNTKIWKILCGFDEQMFIDYVDFDYCCNVIRNDYKIIQVNNALLYHELGRAKQLEFFKKFRKIYYTYNHSPERTYYYARNVLYYLRKNRGYVNTKKEIILFFKWVVLKIIFEDYRLKKLNAIFRGIHDGIRMPISKKQK